MEHPNALTSAMTEISSTQNNNLHHHNRAMRKTIRRQQIQSPSSLTIKNPYVLSVLSNDLHSNQSKIFAFEHKQDQVSMKKPLAWTKKWSKWFSLCSTERTSPSDSDSKVKSSDKRARTKSENDVSKRSSLDQDEKKKLSATNSNFSIGQNSNENQEERLSRAVSQQQNLASDKTNSLTAVLLRDNSRRYSNPFFTSARTTLGGRTSIAVIPATVVTAAATTTTAAAAAAATTTITTTAAAATTTSQNILQKKQTSNSSHSTDRLYSKAQRRELRYEEHDDYIPPPPLPLPLHAIQCHPTIDHYRKSLNQSTYFSSTHRRSQIEAYQRSSVNNRSILPRPYSSNIPVSYSIPIMSKTSPNNKDNEYGKLADCHSPLIPLENSSVKTPRRIESAYSQFPTQQEPIYANTQSLYDNILFPQAVSKPPNNTTEKESKSCASQTQLTWTMATFSSFVDLENQSVIIPQPDPNTLYSIVQHHSSQASPSASPETIQKLRLLSPELRYIDDANSSTHYQRPRTPTSPNRSKVEKRDGSFQTLLTLSPSQDLETNRHLLIHDSTPSPFSTGSQGTTGQQQQQPQQPHHHHHHHHHHRKHKSRNNASPSNVGTRDVGLQVNIQTVKKITFSAQKSDELSPASTTSIPVATKIPPQLKHAETNTEPMANTHDRGTLYDANIHFTTSSSQTFDSPTVSTADRRSQAAQTSAKTFRDQSIETNNQGLFLCDLSSLLTNGLDESPSSK